MIEHLGPNIARSILGNTCNPGSRYGLGTADEGFHVIIANPGDGTSSYVELDPKEPNPGKLKPIWQEGMRKGPLRTDLLSKALLDFLLTTMCIYIATTTIARFV